VNPRDWAFETAVRTLWQEARGEPDEGRQAVAHVIWNRLESRRWGCTLASVCLAPRQFSGWNDGDPNRMAVAEVPDDDRALDHLRLILTASQHASDPTEGALYYYALSVREPSWAKRKICTGRFGNQKFFKEK
jgi:spore germination cell wall hydrolase CwlJ-like protein